MVYKKSRQGVSDMISDDQSAQDFASPRRGGNKIGKIVITLIVVLVILAGAWYALGAYTKLPVPGFTVKQTNNWQAIFLSNGQVYFGKVKSVDNKKMVLADIYYLQVVDVPLQTTQSGVAVKNADGTPKTQQELKLIKLGNELHGPVDEMEINAAFILMTERLKDDSRVVQAIASYVASQKPTPKK